MPLEQRSLLSAASRYHSGLRKTAHFAIGSKEYMQTAFLCHSHNDESLDKGLLVLFKEYGVELYIDWLDSEMPASPNQETASRLQAKIKSAHYFFFLATANSKASRWCPWEIGYADGIGKKVCIIPTSDGQNTYGNEYLQLYSSFDLRYFTNSPFSRFMILEPNKIYV